MLTIQQTLDLPRPAIYPVNLSRFGETPHHEPMWRVVYAPSVYRLIFGRFPDGFTGARPRKSYPQLGSVWILEKWITPWQDTKMTPAEYERYGPRDPQSGMLIDGPYPSKGTYQHCWTFDQDTLQGGLEGALEKIIGMIRQGEGKPYSQVQAENRELDRKQEERDAAQRFLRVRETEPLYGVRPANFAGSPKRVNHKSQRAPVSANDLARRGMPTRRGSCVAMKGKKVQLGV